MPASFTVLCCEKSIQNTVTNLTAKMFEDKVRFVSHFGFIPGTHTLLYIRVLKKKQLLSLS